MGLFNNPKKTVYAIVAFVALFLIALATTCHGAENNGVVFSAGHTALRGAASVIQLEWQWPSIQMHEDWMSRKRDVTDAHWETGVTLIGSSRYYNYSPVRPEPNNFGLNATYIDGFGNVDLGIGAVYLQNKDDYNGSHLNFHLVAGVHYGRFFVRYNHFSNAGTKSPNAGRDMILIGLTL